MGSYNLWQKCLKFVQKYLTFVLVYTTHSAELSHKHIAHIMKYLRIPDDAVVYKYWRSNSSIFQDFFFL